MSTPAAKTSARMPTWFIPHGGGPCFFMEWNPPHAWDRMADFLKSLAATLLRTPKAIVMVSAHWLTPKLTVTSGAQPDLIYDYYGFPPHTYDNKVPRARRARTRSAALTTACSFRSS